MANDGYFAPLVGESAYQQAIKDCRVGDYVDFIIETGNPHSSDGKGLRVDNDRGETIGYIADDSWVKRVLVEEGKGGIAKIHRIAGSRTKGVTLLFAIGNEKPIAIEYGSSLPKARQQGCMGVAVAFATLGAMLYGSGL